MRTISVITIILSQLLGGFAYSQDKEPLKALILTGQCQSYHKWEESSRYLRDYLLDTKIFSVDMAISPPKGNDMKEFAPDFKSYDVVVVDYEGDSWPEPITNDFVDYIRDGGGVVIVHTAFNAINNSQAFDTIVGLGSHRYDEIGPHIYWDEGKTVRDSLSFIGGFHPPPHDFIITVREKEHPVMQGLPEQWLHPSDDLYSNLRGPAKNLTILASAYSDPEKGVRTTGKHEPMLYTVHYGKGRVFVSVLGHVGSDWQGGITMNAILGADFITIFQRGAEWAATGNVTQEVPLDFPTTESISIRKVASEQ